MTTVLDTDVLSELRLPNPDASVHDWISAQPPGDLAIALFSIAEIEFGIAKLLARGRHAAELEAWLNAIVATQRVLALDASGARIFGRLLAIPALQDRVAVPPHARKPRFAGDLAIAATAVAHQALVATRKLADFRLIAQHCHGLAGVDPWTGQTF